MMSCAIRSLRKLCLKPFEWRGGTLVLGLPRPPVELQRVLVENQCPGAPCAPKARRLKIEGDYQ